MFTSVDKALIAVVMAVIYLLNTFAGLHLGVSEEFLNTVIAVITPILVYLIPNKPSSRV